MARRRRSIASLFFFIFLMHSSALLIAGEGKEDDRVELTPLDGLNDVSFVGEQGWVVGTFGLILHSSDGGKSWEEQASGMVDRALLGVNFLDPSHGWVVGQDGTFLRTEDGGKTWEAREVGTQSALLKVKFVSLQRGVVVGEFGTLLMTHNGGEVWSQIGFDWERVLPEVTAKYGRVEPHLYDIFFLNEEEGWIVGEYALILHTNNGGRDWEVVHQGDYPQLYGIAFGGARKGWAVGQQGFILSTTDGGRVWQQVASLTNQDLYSITISGNYGLMIGERVSLATSDAGGKWYPLRTNPAGTAPALTAAASLGQKEFFIVGHFGMMERVIIEREASSR